MPTLEQSEGTLILDRDHKNNSQSNFISELKKMGIKAELITTDPIAVDSYELNAQDLMHRWEIIFKDNIKEHDVSEAQLAELAKQFSEETERMTEWIKSQAKPSDYAVTHAINPNTGEYFTIHHSDDSKPVRSVSVKFNSRGAYFESNT